MSGKKAKNLAVKLAMDPPDPSAANALQEGLGGQFGEMRTMMQYLFQSFNFRGNAVPYLDLIQGVGIEEISHVELISKTIVLGVGDSLGAVFFKLGHLRRRTIG